MKILTFIVLLVSLLTASAQTNFEMDPALDVYGLDVSFEGMVFSDKCDCCCNKKQKPNTCELYKIKVNRVFLYRDTLVYKNIEELLNLKYIVMPSNTVKPNLQESRIYSIIGYNSCAKKFIIVKDVFATPLKEIPNYSGFPFVSGLLECKKFNFFQKICLNLNINREKIYSKAANYPPSRSKFFQKIEKIE